jgi:hypothetical protein
MVTLSQSRLAWTFVCALAVIHPPFVTALQPKPAVADRALAFFATLPAGELTAALRSVRPSPITLRDRDRAIATLPRDGALRPVRDENVKLATLTQILRYHERTGIVEMKVIDVVQAFVGLHARSILLISR